MNRFLRRLLHVTFMETHRIGLGGLSKLSARNVVYNTTLFIRCQ